MKKPLIICSSLLTGALALCAVATPAHAEETQPPPASTSPPPASTSSGGATFAGGAIGIGALAWLSSGAGDAQLVYDATMFHLEVGLGYNHDSYNDNSSDSQFRFGLGGWYHLARGSMADFSLGGAVRMIYTGNRGGGSATTFGLEPGAEARMFFSPNFALSGRIGLLIAFGDNMSPTTFGIGGQTAAALGFTYFFR
jgi:hypothetical protein